MLSKRGRNETNTETRTAKPEFSIAASGLSSGMLGEAQARYHRDHQSLVVGPLDDSPRPVADRHPTLTR
jgi:hypothetical protein